METAASKSHSVELELNERLTKRGSRWVILGALAIVLALASGLHWFGESFDSLDYFQFYNSLTSLTDFTESRFELGFQFSAWVFRTLLDVEFDTFVIAIALVALTVKFWTFLRYTSSPLVAATTYVMFSYALEEYTQLRLAVGLGFAYLAINLMLERRWLWMLLAATVAFLFHASTILLIFAALGCTWIDTWRKLAACAVVAVMLLSMKAGLIDAYLSTFSVLNPLLESYLHNDVALEDVTIYTIDNLLLVVLIGVFGITCRPFDNRWSATFFNLTLCSLVIFIVFLDSPVLAIRFREMFSVSIIFLVCRRPVDKENIASYGLLILTTFYQIYRAFRVGILTF